MVCYVFVVFESTEQQSNGRHVAQLQVLSTSSQPVFGLDFLSCMLKENRAENTVKPVKAEP
jgi:hypothetical protein